MWCGVETSRHFERAQNCNEWVEKEKAIGYGSRGGVDFRPKVAAWTIQSKCGVSENDGPFL